MNQLQTIFEEAEYQQEPAAGYRVVFLYHKKTEDLEAVLDSYGKRPAGTAIAMPSEKDTFHSGSVQLKDNKLNQLLEARKIKLFRSKSDRLLLVPEEQISHWFEADRSRQICLLKTAVSISRAIEEIFPESLTTEGFNIFELHVGSEAGQTISQLHMRFESGPMQGRLTPEIWEDISL